MFEIAHIGGFLRFARLRNILWKGLLLQATTSLLFGQAPITFQYFYDDLNQLVKVVDSAGIVVSYVYDPVGNIQQIVRSTVTPGALTIFNITPQTVAAGGTLTIQGQGFSSRVLASSVRCWIWCRRVADGSTSFLVHYEDLWGNSKPYLRITNAVISRSVALDKWAQAVLGLDPDWVPNQFKGPDFQ